MSGLGKRGRGECFRRLWRRVLPSPDAFIPNRKIQEIIAIIIPLQNLRVQKALSSPRVRKGTDLDCEVWFENSRVIL
jgi:hypothetical protein